MGTHGQNKVSVVGGFKMRVDIVVAQPSSESNSLPCRGSNGVLFSSAIVVSKILFCLTLIPSKNVALFE